MYLRAVEAEGLHGAGPLGVEAAERVAALPSGPDGARLADAIEVWAATLRPDRLPALARRLLGSEPAVVGEGEEIGLADLDPDGVAAFLSEDARSVTVQAEVVLDPGLYGRLREQAHRDPRLLSALSGAGGLIVKVGWLFSRDLRHLSPSVLQVRAGDVVFETVGRERPAWVPTVLHALGTRVHRTDPFEPVERLAERLHEASVSPDPKRRQGCARTLADAAAAPFSLPAPGFVRERGGMGLVFGPDLVRLRAMGRPAWDLLRHLEAAWVERPDVLLLDEAATPEIRAHLAALTEAPDAPIEQVWTR